MRTENSMEEDFIVDSAADVGGSNTTPPQQNNTDNFSSPPPEDTAAPSAPGSITFGTDASMHTLKDKETFPLDAFPNKDIMDTNDTSPLPPDTPTISILRRDYQAAAHFMEKQWAIYCYSTCLRITPCSLSLNQKKSRREFVAVLSQLPPNTKDVHLAHLVRLIGAIAVNIPLFLNSYKPKRWAYITFASQQMMDNAIEQTIALQGHRLQWELPANTNKLCHRCGKLGCAPTACPLNNSRGRSLDNAPVLNLRNVPIPDNRNDTSVPNSFGHIPPLVDPNCSQIQEIFSVLKSLQEDIASQDDALTSNPNDSPHMLVNNHQSTLHYITQSNLPTSNIFFSSPVLPPPTVLVLRSITSFSPIPVTADENTINKECAEIYSFQRSLDNKFDYLSDSIERFISSISGDSSSDQVNKTSSD
ncbi:hypothetical protein RhiirC2_794655 [Rhizophagus irregularis]|uniref:RRM domain-containing protein n=1 Tax=Rhizophagus irregularis TaxID=588596 RepID=A0A2N1MDD0_9GLOM|nr:hypothetical protein RhiirC2_794655 [Rhizophagus irregularis]